MDLRRDEADERRWSGFPLYRICQWQRVRLVWRDWLIWGVDG
jgi:hypothetical protein